MLKSLHRIALHYIMKHPEASNMRMAMIVYSGNSSTLLGNRRREVGKVDLWVCRPPKRISFKRTHSSERIHSRTT